MKLDGLSHPKTKELALTLGIPLPHAVGLLDFLWAFVGQQTPRGNIGKWSNGVIAQESQWTGDADEFVNALIQCRFLDQDEQHRLIVHDWHEHAPNWVHAKLKKRGETVLRGDLRADLRGDLSEPQEGATSLGKANQGKSRQGKCKDGGASAPQLAKPDWLDLQVWNDYRSFRTSKKAKLTPTAWERIRAEIERGMAAGIDPNDMLGEAMEAGWTGFKLEWYQNRAGKPQAAQVNGPRNLLS